MMNHLNNSNNDQNIERPPHFKDVFNSNEISTNVVDNNINTSESRRPSLVIMSSNNHEILHLSSLSTKRPSNNNNNNDTNLNNSNDTEMINQNNLNTSKTIEITNQILNENPILQQSTTSIQTVTLPLINNNSNNLNSNKNYNNNQLISKFQKLNIPSSNKFSSLKKSNKLTKNVKISKKFRSKSLPNIYIPSKRSHQLLTNIQKQNNLSIQKQNQINQSFENRHQIQNQFKISQNSINQQHQQQQQQQMLLLPPVNLHSMHEIDLQEVLKNPQLRHDILFDPQLQFRPNLDGERGQRKKIQSENYWNMIKLETKNLLNDTNNSIKLNENSPIIIMFQCLKGILISLIPAKDISLIDEILDVNLLIQQLNSKCFNFIEFSNWICSIFKLHCAPMRDSWVDELNSLFYKACENSIINIDYLIQGFETLFLILEAMKLDVANHQIRILRPLLCSSAISFEQEYFNNAIKRNKINFTSSLLWFKKNSINLNSNDVKQILNYSTLNLLSCSNMCRQFPNILNFDHTRLLLLRADIRHIICTKISSILYKTLIHQYNLDKSLLSDEKMLKFRSNILNIIVDDNGNSKWTKNLKNLAIQIVNTLFNNLDSNKIDFAYNWLLKQTQPNSKVYTLLESKLFEKILPCLSKSSDLPSDINTSNNTNKINDDIIINKELSNIVERLNQIIEFNYYVFNDIYSSYLE
jgi:hypothetical protein